MDSVSRNVTNTISTTVTSTVSINSDDTKVRYKLNCYILHTFLLVTRLLFMITISCYHYAKIGQNKKMLTQSNIKMENIELKTLFIKSCMLLFR